MIYGIDVNPLTREKRTGTERYVFCLLKEMMQIPLREDEKVVLYASEKVEDFGALPKGWSWRILPDHLGHGWTHVRLAAELLLRPPEVFFTPAHEVPGFLRRKTKVVATIHDVAFRVHPQLYPEAERRRQEWSTRWAMRRADTILTVSEASKEDIIEAYHVPEENVVVTPLAPTEISTGDVKREMQILQPYFFTLSRMEKKKNITLLIEAYAKYRQAVENPWNLVLGGSLGFGGEEIARKAEETEGVTMLGYVPDDEVAGWMQHAASYVFPTKYEGFGMPALEAMTVGLPLLVSDIPVMREVCGSEALYAHPDNIDAWVKGLEEVSGEGKQDYSEWLRNFSWSVTAEMTFDVLRSLWKS